MCVLSQQQGNLWSDATEAESCTHKAIGCSVNSRMESGIQQGM